MKKFAFAMIGLLALAGCTSPPASDSWTSSGTTFAPEGSVVTADFVEYDDPTPQPLKDQGVECVGDNLPDEGDAQYGQYKCTEASSEIGIHVMGLPDGDWSMALAVSDDPAITDTGSPMTMAPNMEMAYDWNKTSSDEDYSQKYDQVNLMLNGAIIGSVPLNQGGALTLADFMGQVSYDLAYEGSEFTVNVSGLNGNFTYSGWLITTDEAGEVTHAQEFVSLANGENLLTAEMDGDAYSGFHIHIAGTSINVATGGPAA